MDPYLERRWGDIHHRLVMYACDQIQEYLPASLRARVEERVFLEIDDTRTRSITPDIRVIEHSRQPHHDEEPEFSDGPGGVAVAKLVAKPLVIVRNEPLTEGYIEIRDGESGNRVVTVIEVLSPANKSGGNGTREYRQKQQEVLSGDASLVEIDLLRRGRRMFAASLEMVPEARQKTYLICVSRGWRAGESEIYGATLRERLPVIPIPLRPTDRDARLDLQSLVDQAYRRGRYDDTDYRQELDPPLGSDEAKWADELLKAQARR
jgi:hypothetical protein